MIFWHSSFAIVWWQRAPFISCFQNGACGEHDRATRSSWFHDCDSKLKVLINASKTHKPCSRSRPKWRRSRRIRYGSLRIPDSWPCAWDRPQVRSATAQLAGEPNCFFFALVFLSIPFAVQASGKKKMVLWCYSQDFTSISAAKGVDYGFLCGKISEIDLGWKQLKMLPSGNLT